MTNQKTYYLETYETTYSNSDLEKLIESAATDLIEDESYPLYIKSLTILDQDDEEINTPQKKIDEMIKKIESDVDDQIKYHLENDQYSEEKDYFDIFV